MVSSSVLSKNYMINRADHAKRYSKASKSVTGYYLNEEGSMKPLEENLKTIKYLTQEEVSRLFSKTKDKRYRALLGVMYKYSL